MPHNPEYNLEFNLKSETIKAMCHQGRMLVAERRHFTLKLSPDYLLRWLDTLPALPPLF